VIADIPLLWEDDRCPFGLAASWRLRINVMGEEDYYDVCLGDDGDVDDASHPPRIKALAPARESNWGKNAPTPFT